MVPSDVRVLLSEIERLQGVLDHLNRDLDVEHGQGTAEQTAEYNAEYGSTMVSSDNTPTRKSVSVCPDCHATQDKGTPHDNCPNPSEKKETP